LADKQRTSRIDAEPSGGERFGTDRRGEFFGIGHLQTLCERVCLNSAGSRIDEANSIQHIDRNAKIPSTGLDQRYGPLSKSRVTRNRKYNVLACARRTQHSLRDRWVEITKISGAFIEVVAVGHPRIGGQVAETGMDPGPQDDALCRI
jgi:hypothetical protein